MSHESLNVWLLPHLNFHVRKPKATELYVNLGARVKCELRVAKLRVGILRVEVRASTRLVSYF